MKRVILFILIFLLLFSSSYAGAVALPEENIIGSRAITSTYEWQRFCKTRQQNTLNDNSIILLGLAQNILDMTLDVLLTENVSSENKSNLEGIDTSGTKATDDYLIPQYDESEDSNNYRTNSVYFDDINVYVQSDLLFREGYYLGKNYLLDSDGSLLAEMQVELGKRDETIALLIIDFDNTNYTTGRYILKMDEANKDDDTIFFTKSFGKNMDIVLNVDAWQQGQYVEWSEDLLLPATVLFH